LPGLDFDFFFQETLSTNKVAEKNKLYKQTVDLDEDDFIQTADAERTLAKRRKLIKEHQGQSNVVELQ